MEQQTATDEAKTIVKTLEVGDVIRVPQYKGSLRVNHTGELNGEENAFIGLEFADESKQTSADKSMIVNRHSGRVYLSAGTTDKGEVPTIEVAN